jgi:hypothetical protein
VGRDLFLFIPAAYESVTNLSVMQRR